MRDRKQCFEKYVKIRVVEERKERIQKLKEKKEDFKRLLDDVIASARYELFFFFEWHMFNTSARCKLFLV